MPLLVMYGSATGNGEGIAGDLAAKAKDLLLKYDKRVKLNKLKSMTTTATSDSYTNTNTEDSLFFNSVKCLPLDNFKKALMTLSGPYSLIIITSTTGNGDAPENASSFFRYVKKKPADANALPFNECYFSVLGLGDTNYSKFNECARVIDKRLGDLGGNRVKDVMMADEATGLEEVVEPFCDTVFKDFENYFKSLVRVEAVAPITVAQAPAPAPIEQQQALPLPIPLPTPTPTPTIISPRHASNGVTAIKALCSSLALAPSSCDPVASIEDKLLPGLPSSSSSCLLLDSGTLTPPFLSSTNLTTIPADGDGAWTHSSTDSSTFFTCAKPYDSKIMSARYLTQTDWKMCRGAADTLLAPTPYSEGGDVEDKKNDDDVDCSGSQHLNAWGAVDKLCSTFVLVHNTDDENAKEVFENNSKRVIELELGLPEDFSLEYSPGDAIGIIVNNDKRVVDVVLSSLLKHHGTLEFQDIIFEDSDEPITVRDAISGRIDICSAMKKRTLFALSEHTSNKDEKNSLRYLSSKSPHADLLYNKFVIEQQLNLADVLTLFPSCCPSITTLLSIFTSITPRYYSVTSSPLSNAMSLKFAFSVVDDIITSSTNNQTNAPTRRFNGLATAYMEALASPLLCKIRGGRNMAGYSPTLRIFPKPTKEFKLPANNKYPLILIGPGTGVAPFMGFISHRKKLKAQSIHSAAVACEGTWRGGFDLEEGDVSVGAADTTDYASQISEGEVHIFFGCRTHHDWIYKKEMLAMVESKEVKSCNVGFSRMKGQEKEYVQDIMRKEVMAKNIVRLMFEESGCIFICGDGTKMAKDVILTLEHVINEHTTEEQTRVLLVEGEKEKEGKEGNDHGYRGRDVRSRGAKVIEALKMKRRLLLDIWGG